MVAPRYRSKTFKRVHKRAPGGRRVTHFERRKTGVPQCGSCGAKLPGTARGRPSALRNLPKSFKRPERPYGGNLCSRCTRAVFKQKAQSI